MHNTSYAFHLVRAQATGNSAEARLGFRRCRTGLCRAYHLLRGCREDYGEERCVTLGLLRGQVVVIVQTETEDEIRVISMRTAERDERLLFFRNL
jgi:uncharacterized DUF497 family protein